MSQRCATFTSAQNDKFYRKGQLVAGAAFGSRCCIDWNCMAFEIDEVRRIAERVAASHHQLGTAREQAQRLAGSERRFLRVADTARLLSSRLDARKIQNRPNGTGFTYDSGGSIRRPDRTSAPSRTAERSAP